MRHRLALQATRLTVLALLLTICNSASAQDTKRPRLKDFGSSLKRIKWDDEKKIAVDVKPSVNGRAQSDDVEVIKVETSFVTSDVLVLDSNGNSVPGLSDKDFVISEDGQPQRASMVVFGESPNVPRSIVLIMDYGCSQLPFVRASVAAAKLMVDKLAAADRVAIVTDDIELVDGFTSDKAKLKQALGELLRRTDLNPVNRQFSLDRFSQGHAPFGHGFQYSALMAVLKEAFDAEDQRPVIIFQTDGSEAALLRNPIITPIVAPGLPRDLREEAERRLHHFEDFRKRHPREFSIDDIYRAAEHSRATIYSVIPGLQFIGLKVEERPAQMRAYIEREMAGFDVGNARKEWDHYLNNAGDAALAYDAENLMKEQSALGVLSTISGGWTEFFDQPSQADEIYSRIFSDINCRYIVGYYSTNKAHDGKRRKVNITVRDHPDYVVMGHKAYYGPGLE